MTRTSAIGRHPIQSPERARTRARRTPRCARRSVKWRDTSPARSLSRSAGEVDKPTPTRPLDVPVTFDVYRHLVIWSEHGLKTRTVLRIRRSGVRISQGAPLLSSTSAASLSITPAQCRFWCSFRRKQARQRAAPPPLGCGLGAAGVPHDHRRRLPSASPAGSCACPRSHG